MRPTEYLALATLLLGMALISPDLRTPWLVLGVASVTILTARVPWRRWGGTLAAPLPFLLASLGAVALASRAAHGATPTLMPLLARALRAYAASAAVAMAALTVPPAVAAGIAVRLRLPTPAVDVLVLAARTIQRVGGELHTRMTLARRRGGTHSWRSRLRTAGWLAASLAGLCHRRALQLDAVFTLRGPVRWGDQARWHPPARPLVLAAMLAGAVGWMLVTG